MDEKNNQKKYSTIAICCIIIAVIANIIKLIVKGNVIFIAFLIIPIIPLHFWLFLAASSKTQIYSKKRLYVSCIIFLIIYILYPPNYFTFHNNGGIGFSYFPETKGIGISGLLELLFFADLIYDFDNISKFKSKKNNNKIENIKNIENDSENRDIIENNNKNIEEKMEKKDSWMDDYNIKK